MSHSDPDLAAPVDFRDARQFGELSGVNAADGDGETGVIQPRLLLPEDADVIGAVRPALLPTGGVQRPVRAALELAAEFFRAPILDEKRSEEHTSELQSHS